ncbi:restriction endonuclease subunit S [Actinomyces urogenitalis]|uniref:restriction endonuclease subunit S n=1 Tax=Actinomyces urogenitalis TaxID=103621 RepID=UPI00389994DE
MISCGDAGGRIDANYGPNAGSLSKYRPGDILIGNIRPYLKKIWLADRIGGCSGDVLVLSLTEDFRNVVFPRFLYCLLSREEYFRRMNRHARGGKMPRGDKRMVLAYRVPVPPLEIQQEIVRLLDQFAQLEAR